MSLFVESWKSFCVSVAAVSLMFDTVVPVINSEQFTDWKSPLADEESIWNPVAVPPLVPVMRSCIPETMRGEDDAVSTHHPRISPENALDDAQIAAPELTVREPVLLALNRQLVPAVYEHLADAEALKIPNVPLPRNCQAVKALVMFPVRLSHTVVLKTVKAVPDVHFAPVAI
jgi:hypothetical protein